LLCAQTMGAPHSEFEPALAELKLALHEHTERSRKLAASKRSNGRPIVKASASGLKLRVRQRTDSL